MKISVITVCYNAEKVIQQTMQSVMNQSYADIEYIIIDGASTDGTMELVKKCADDKRVRYISEPDNGIYDAMNKGIRLATGDYLEFLNAGDVFVNNDVIKSVVQKIEENPADVMYGDIIYEYPDKTTSIRVYGQFCSSLLYYLLGDCINHQAIFASRECFEKYIFDTEYRICADREWMIRIKKGGMSFYAMNLLICKYPLEEDSASIKNKELSDREAELCVKKHLKLGYPVFWMLNKIRSGKVSAKVLHGIYKIVFLRKSNTER